MTSRVIAGVLVSAMFLVVAYAFAQAPAGLEGPPMRGPHGPMDMRHMTEHLDRALDRAGVSPEQRVKVYEARDQLLAAFTAQRGDPRATRDQMLAAFEAPQLTQAQLDTLHQAQEQRMRAVRAAIDRAILDVHATLTPAQRKIVAEYFRAHPMMPGRAPHHAGPPDGPGRPMGGAQGPGPR